MKSGHYSNSVLKQFTGCKNVYQSQMQIKALSICFNQIFIYMALIYIALNSDKNMSRLFSILASEILVLKFPFSCLL